MGREELRALKAVSASQGLMLESTAPALLRPGGAHQNCPDKARSWGGTLGQGSVPPLMTRCGAGGVGCLRLRCKVA